MSCEWRPYSLKNHELDDPKRVVTLEFDERTLGKGRILKISAEIIAWLMSEHSGASGWYMVRQHPISRDWSILTWISTYFFSDPDTAFAFKLRWGGVQA